MSPSLAALLFWISVTVCTIAELAVVAATVRASRRSAAANAAAMLDVPHVDGARPLPGGRERLEAFGDLVFETKIRKTIRYAEAPVKGTSVLKYDSKGKAARAYRELAGEVLRDG